MANCGLTLSNPFKLRVLVEERNVCLPCHCLSIFLFRIFVVFL